jgi:ubiquinone/menaquinone biosynthesis C-methylase UbiE
MDVSQQPSPILIFDTINAHQRTAALKGAIELDLFSAIAEGNQTAKEIAARCEASERGTRILCDFLTVCGFLTKQGDKYDLTLDSKVFLDRRSPAYMGGATEFLLSPMLVEAFNDVAGAVRTGSTMLPQEGSVTPENPVWVKFARAMAPMMMMASELMADAVLKGSQEKMKILDIAAGHGLFGIAFAKKNPNAEVVALDWASVLEVAKENAEQAGVADRHSLLPGSAFDVEFGEGYDLVLLTNFLHHFDPETCETLLRKVHRSLNDGGRVATLEFIPDENRITPPPSACFGLIMLATTPKGDAYTFSELDTMFKNAGFKHSELHELGPVPNRLVISEK